MKMAKKFMALALAVVLSVGCAFCVSADGSRTKNITVSQEQSKIYEVLQKIEETDGFKELKEEYPEIAEVLQKVGEGKMDMKGFIDFLKTLATEEKDEMDAVMETNKMMSWFMPLMSVSVAIIAPLGLALYWLINNLLMIAERLILNKVIKTEEE